MQNVVVQLEVPNVTVDSCRARQQRLRDALRKHGLYGALIGNCRHVFYLSGYWCRPLYTPLLLMEVDGPTTLSMPLPGPTDHLAVDVAAIYEAARFFTLVDDQWSAALRPLNGRLATMQRLGTDVPNHFLPEELDIRPILTSMRRRKDPDEVALIRCAVGATEAAYQYALETLREGITEVELFAGMQAVVANAVGETVGEFGNDFQFGSPGGPPRRRAARKGEIAVLDLSVVVRGYTSDMSRSFVVGGQPTAEQCAAQARIAETFSQLENTIRPGVRCGELFDMASRLLDGFHGWRFTHHLGHGIGLAAHEAPRLNPHYDDQFQIGDVFTLEPGLYGDNLHAGLRIENDYLLSEAGLVRLSQFPIELA